MQLIIHGLVSIELPGRDHHPKILVEMFIHICFMGLKVRGRGM